MGTGTESVAQDQIVAFVDRILRMKGEAKAIKDDIREIYAEAKGNGFDKTVLGKLVSYVEKRDADSNAVLEAESVFDLYLAAYDGAKGKVGTPHATHTHAPEAPGNGDIGGLKQGTESAPRTNEGAAATETAPDYLREPPAVVSGQIRREGDAPLEVDRQAPADSEVLTGEHPPSNSPQGVRPDKPEAGQPASAPRPRTVDEIADSMGLPSEPHPSCKKQKTCGRFSHVKLCLDCRVAAGLEMAGAA